MSENHEVEESAKNDLASAWRRVVELSAALDAANAELTIWRDGNILHETHRDELEKLERERDEAQTTLTNIYRWIERNHSDGFIISLKYVENLERIADYWYNRYDIIECERDELRTQNAKLQAELVQLKEGAQ